MDLGQCRLLLPPGSGARSVGAHRAALLRGSCWVCTEVPFAMETPAGTVQVERGDALFTVAAATPAAGLFREASAAVPDEVSFTLLDGTRAARGEASWTGPCRVTLQGDGATRDPLDERGLERAFEQRGLAEGAGPWEEIEGGVVGRPASPHDVLAPLPAGVSATALEATVKVPEGGQLGFCYPVHGGTAVTTLGGGALRPGTLQTFRVFASGGMLDIYVDARRLSSTPLRAERPFQPDRAVGLRVWTGPAEVRRLRWRTLDGSR